MGGIPRHFYLSLAIPRSCSYEFLDQFMAGILAMADTYDVVLAGGDTCASCSGLVVSVTVVGEQFPDLVVKRSGATPGDQIFVTGTLGDSALGLAMLRGGERQGGPVDRHNLPTPRLLAGQMLAEARIVTAMIDISDGLAADLGHILEASGVGAKVEEKLLPLAEGFREKAVSYSDDPLEFAISGGEDYELLFTSPSAYGSQVVSLLRQEKLAVTRIGEIVAGTGLSFIKENGVPRRLEKVGYDHFA
jgi:thiamine-monophosphate kinase